MQIVIEIDEELFDAIHDGYIEPNDHFYVMDAVRDGIPLPEHHGRLIDADALETISVWESGRFEAVLKEDIDEAPTIIPATKEGE